MQSKKEKEIELLLWFMPSTLKHINITKEDIKKFFEYDEQGKHKKDIKLSHFDDGFNALIGAKQNRGRNMEFWEDGIMSGLQPYNDLLGNNEGCITRRWYNPMRYFKGKYKFYNIPLPRNVVDFMKKELFKGMDAELIEKLYQNICKN